MKRSKMLLLILYVIWSALNIAMLIMALKGTFGEFDKSAEKFWPFSIGSPKYYDYLELAVYLLIPLVVYYGTRLVHYYHNHKEQEVPYLSELRETVVEINKV